MAETPSPPSRPDDDPGQPHPTQPAATAPETSNNSTNPPTQTDPQTLPLDASSPITNLYLAFSTPLPKPNTSSSPQCPSPQAPPAFPDLSKYTNPTTWPARKKYTLLLLSCIATFLTAYTAGYYSPPQHILLRTLSGASSTTDILTGITSFCLGFGLAPMFLAPFSEMNGRYPVFVISGFVYVLFEAVCGVVDSLAGMVIARMMVGIGASVFSTMVGGVISDIWEKEERNTPMALFAGSVIMGTGAGPLVGAYMAFRWDEPSAEDDSAGGLSAKWRWVFWHQVIMGAVLMFFLVIWFKESRGSVLLSRKARKLNEWYERLESTGFYGVFVEEGTELKRVRWIVKEDEERSSIGKMIAISVTRPFGMLFTEPVVFFFSLYVAFAWGILYLTFGCIPLVFHRQYGWDLEKGGRVFLALIVGAILSTILSIWQERILYHPQWRAVVPGEGPTDDEEKGEQSDAVVQTSTSEDDDEKRTPPFSSASSTTSSASSIEATSSTSKFWPFMRRKFPAQAPEARLYFTCLTSTLLPIGMFLFGFTARPHIHWIVPCIGITLAAMGILSVYLAVFNYLADTYHKYASSALAAQSFCRNALGGVFPLITASMVHNLGEAKAIGMLGGIATVLTVVPWVLVFFGETIRARSPFASELSKRG
ncbi:Major facilitator superfamily domain containing protein [Rhypophila sp. PSN 637]